MPNAPRASGRWATPLLGKGRIDRPQAGRDARRMYSEATAAGVAPPGLPTDLTRLVNDYLEKLRFAREPGVSGLQEAMRYSLLAPGKRVRPVLALATARAIGQDPREVLPLAAALELIHTFTLVHDDLPALDDDELRRGRPTAHMRFGE